MAIPGPQFPQSGPFMPVPPAPPQWPPAAPGQPYQPPMAGGGMIPPSTPPRMPPGPGMPPGGGMPPQGPWGGQQVPPPQFPPGGNRQGPGTGAPPPQRDRRPSGDRTSVTPGTQIQLQLPSNGGAAGPHTGAMQGPGVPTRGGQQAAALRKPVQPGNGQAWPAPGNNY